MIIITGAIVAGLRDHYEGHHGNHDDQHDDPRAHYHDQHDHDCVVGAKWPIWEFIMIMIRIIMILVIMIRMISV